jgi:hypothetical protein
MAKTLVLVGRGSYQTTRDYLKAEGFQVAYGRDAEDRNRMTFTSSEHAASVIIVSVGKRRYEVTAPKKWRKAIRATEGVSVADDGKSGKAPSKAGKADTQAQEAPSEAGEAKPVVGTLRKAYPWKWGTNSGVFPKGTEVLLNAKGGWYVNVPAEDRQDGVGRALPVALRKADAKVAELADTPSEAGEAQAQEAPSLLDTVRSKLGITLGERRVFIASIFDAGNQSVMALVDGRRIVSTLVVENDKHISKLLKRAEQVFVAAYAEGEIEL